MYKVYPADVDGLKMGNRTIFKVKENSHCTARFCCFGPCRPFEMKITNNEASFSKGNIDSNIFM